MPTRVNENTSQGPIRLVPAGTANGTELTGRAASTSGIRFYLANADSVTLFIGARGTTYAAPPALTVTYLSAADGYVVDEPTAGSDSIFITATSGTPKFRWVQR